MGKLSPRIPRLNTINTMGPTLLGVYPIVPWLTGRGVDPTFKHHVDKILTFGIFRRNHRFGRGFFYIHNNLVPYYWKNRPSWHDTPKRASKQVATWHPMTDIPYGFLGIDKTMANVIENIWNKSHPTWFKEDLGNISPLPWDIRGAIWSLGFSCYFHTKWGAIQNPRILKITG